MCSGLQLRFVAGLATVEQLRARDGAEAVAVSEGPECLARLGSGMLAGPCCIRGGRFWGVLSLPSLPPPRQPLRSQRASAHLNQTSERA